MSEDGITEDRGRIADCTEDRIKILIFRWSAILLPSSVFCLQFSVFRPLG